MTDSNILSVFGLIADIIGAILLFIYGLPSEMFNRKLSLEEKEKVKEHNKKYNVLSYEDIMDEADIAHMRKTKTRAQLGLILLMVGFALQLLAQLPFTTNNPPSDKVKCCCHNSH